MYRHVGMMRSTGPILSRYHKSPTPGLFCKMQQRGADGPHQRWKKKKRSYRPEASHPHILPGRILIVFLPLPVLSRRVIQHDTRNRSVTWCLDGFAKPTSTLKLDVFSSLVRSRFTPCQLTASYQPSNVTRHSTAQTPDTYFTTYI